MFAIHRSISAPDARSTPDTRLAAALERRSGARSSRFSDVLEGPGRGQEGGGTRGPSQNYVSGAESARIPSSAGTTPATTPAASSEHPGLAKLRETFQALGMNTSVLQISYSEETVGYPGGSYVNKLIKVQSGDKVENFCAELTAKNALVTAYEMQRYFGVSGNSGTFSQQA